MSALVSLQYDILNETSGDMNTAINLTQLFSAVEYGLVSIRPTVVHSKDTNVLLHEACRLVLLTNMCYIQRDFPKCSTVLTTLHSRLTHILKVLEPFDQLRHEYHRKLVLWILLVGGISSLQPERYADLISRLLVQWKVAECEEVYECCREFVWSDKIASEVSYTLASEVRCRMWPLLVTSQGERILGSEG
jgi:hypothetical protein